MTAVMLFFNKMAGCFGLSKTTIIEKTALLFFTLSPILLIVSRSAADVAFGLVSLLFLLHCFVHKSWGWIKDSYFIGFLVLWIWLFIVSYLAVTDMHASFSRALAWGRFIPLVFAAKYWLLTKKENRVFIIKTVAIVLGYVAVDTVFQWAVGFSFEGHVSDNGIRMTGPFDAEVVGTYLSKLIMVTIGGGLFVFGNLRKKPLVVGAGLFVALVVLAVLVSGERMAFLSLLLALAVFSLAARRLRKALLAIGVMAGLIVVAIIMATPTVKVRLIDSTHKVLMHFEHSEYGMIYNNSLMMVARHPVTGVGLKNYRYVCLERPYQTLRNRGRNCGLHPHNTYLEWAAEAGLVGLALFVGLISWIIGSAIKNARQLEGPEYYLALGALTSLIPFLWPIMSSMSLFSNWNALLFWFVMAWVFSFTSPKHYDYR